MYTILDTVIKQISVPELKTAVRRDVLDLLSRDDARRSSGRDAGDLPPPLDDASAALAQRAGLDILGDQTALARRCVVRAQQVAETIRVERLHQARRSFNVAVGMSIVGMVVILAGLILVLRGVVTAGVITAISGTVCEAVGRLAFQWNRQATDRLDAINRDITLLANALMAVELVAGISDQPSRDRATADAVRALLATRPSR